MASGSQHTAWICQSPHIITIDVKHTLPKHAAWSSLPSDVKKYAWQLQWLVYCLWVLAEIAIAATDLAEIIGSAVALNLLFNIPLYAGVIITAVDVLFIIAFGMKNFRFLEV